MSIGVCDLHHNIATQCILQSIQVFTDTGIATYSTYKIITVTEEQTLQHIASTRTYTTLHTAHIHIHTCGCKRNLQGLYHITTGFILAVHMQHICIKYHMCLYVLHMCTCIKFHICSICTLECRRLQVRFVTYVLQIKYKSHIDAQTYHI